MPEKPASRPSGSKATAPRRIRLPKIPRINWRTHDLTAVEFRGDNLITELFTYQKNIDLLLQRKGEYVLIKGEEIVGYYPDIDSALDGAVERFGREPALVKEIVEFEPIHSPGGLIL